MRRFAAENPRLESLPEVLGLVTFCALLGPWLGATVSCITLAWVEGGRFTWILLLKLWSGEMAGVLLVAPIVARELSPAGSSRWLGRVRPLEATILLVSVVVTAWVVTHGEQRFGLGLKYLVLPWIGLAALRLGLRGATATLCAVIITFSAHDYLDRDAAKSQGLRRLQEAFAEDAFLAVASLTGVLMATVSSGLLLREDEWQRSEARYRALFENSLSGVAIHELVLDERGQPADYSFIEINPAFEKHSGLRRTDCLGRRVTQVIPGIEHSDFIQRYGQVVLTGRPDRFEHDVPQLKRHFEIQAFALGGRQFAAVFSDISERKQSEAELKRAHAQQTVLLKEVHHRVKNNLQVTTSLVHLQAVQVKNPDARAALQDTQARLRAMALLHETLYQSERMDLVDCGRYVEHLCRYLAQTFALGERGIALQRQVSPSTLALGIGQAVTCGLILNELVSNACKHAFPAGRKGLILAELAAEGESGMVLRVVDDGIGLPAGLQVEQSQTLGLDLVCGLTRQLGGELKINRNPGSDFEIRFLRKHEEVLLT
jgi:PAS domain S-box-containing protein